MVTPFDDQEAIDYRATEVLLDYLINSGVSGVFILGTNGEAHVLSEEEKLSFARHVVRYVSHRVTVIAGVGMNSTQETLDLAHQMIRTGIDAFSVVPPSFVHLTQQELVRHYSEIASNVSIPVMMYNMPKLTGNNLDVATVAMLSKHANIIGIKDSSGSLDNIKAYIETTPDDFKVLSGSDSLILDTLMAGGDGAVAATTNLIAPIIVGIYDAYERHDLEAAKDYQLSIEALRTTLKLGSVPAVIKACVTAFGIPVGPARRPVIMPTGKSLETVRDTVAFYKERMRG